LCSARKLSMGYLLLKESGADIPVCAALRVEEDGRL
jgi:hypothetical protein